MVGLDVMCVLECELSTSTNYAMNEKTSGNLFTHLSLYLVEDTLYCKIHKTTPGFD